MQTSPTCSLGSKEVSVPALKPPRRGGVGGGGLRSSPQRCGNGPHPLPPLGSQVSPTPKMDEGGQFRPVVFKSVTVAPPQVPPPPK